MLTKFCLKSLLKDQINNCFFEIIKNRSPDLLKIFDPSTSQFFRMILEECEDNVRHQMLKNKIAMLDRDIENLTIRHNTKKNIAQLNVLELKKQLKQIVKEKKNLKNIFKKLAKEQRYYYMEIIKKGIDVRFEFFLFKR